MGYNARMTIPSPGFRQKTLHLVRRLEEILLERGALPPAEACRLLLHSRRVPPALAARILQDLVAGDRRFLLDPAGSVVLAPAPAPLSPRLREARFTVLDLETTGGSPSSDRILEVGAVRVERGRIHGSFATLVNPGVPIPPFISSMTGIREEMVAGAPSFPAVAEEIAPRTTPNATDTVPPAGTVRSKIVMWVGQDASKKARPRRAGFIGLKPNPPNTILPTAIAKKEPIAGIHKGTCAEMLNANNSPVTTALPSLTVIGFFSNFSMTASRVFSRAGRTLLKSLAGRASAQSM